MQAARKWLVMCALIGAVAVVLGAFAGHGLENSLSSNALKTFKTANQYHFYHVLALAMSVILGRVLSLNPRWHRVANGGFLIGILLFSGSLYALATTDIKMFAYITPIGGISWIVAWCALAASALKEKK